MSRKKHLYNVCLTNQSILIPYHVISTVILYTKFCKEKKNIYTYYTSNSIYDWNEWKINNVEKNFLIETKYINIIYLQKHLSFEIWHNL